MDELEKILGHWGDATQNPNLRLTSLGDDLTVQLLSNLEPFGDYSCNVLRNMRGKILGYNTMVCPLE